MVSNTAAQALSSFLSATPEAGSAKGGPGDLIDQLGQTLLQSGDQGLSFQDTMNLSGLSRSDFLSALSSAQSAGIVETFDDTGVQKLKLTASGRSLY